MGHALYRKYRSKHFSDVIGQDHIVTTLQNSLNNNTLSHAYLFTGPRGVGKTSVARLLAHAINDLPYDEATTHLDIIEIDAASNRRIDEIRELRDKVHIAPTHAKYKVYIIDEVHMLTREAFNALLKTLEEPPAHAIFILATTELHKVPETIVSRTQRFSFRPIQLEDAVAHMRTIADKESIQIDDEALALLATHGKGSFRDSISMLDQMAGFSENTITAEDVGQLLGLPQESLLHTILQSVSEADVTTLFATLAILQSSGAQVSLTAQALISLLRQQVADTTQNHSAGNAIHLMKELLPLSANTTSYEALEIALLSALPIDTSEPATTPPARRTPDAAVKQTPVTTAETPKPKKISKPDALPAEMSQPETPKQEAPNVVSAEQTDGVTPEQPLEHITSPAKTTKEKSGDWNILLQEIKSSHNTLYGILRMAEVHETASTITLSFRFEFHKKQVAQQKNLSMLNTLIASHYNPVPKIELAVQASADDKPASIKIDVPEVSKPNNDTLSSISNIFGGAELLES